MPSAREIFWLDVPGVRETKRRVCVVVRAEADYVAVIYGQATPNASMQNVEISERSSFGRIAGLTKDTHFREENVLLVEHRLD